MKDLKFVVIFVGIGLILAYLASGPLRRPAENIAIVGTPLQSPLQSSQVYAEGLISIGDKIKSEEIQGKTLFIIARAFQNGQPIGGPPLAVKKIDSPTFPINFEITSADNMVGPDFYEGDLSLIVRFDKDGIAGPKQPDDIETIVHVIPRQTRHTEIVLSK